MKKISIIYLSILLTLFAQSCSKKKVITIISNDGANIVIDDEIFQSTAVIEGRIGSKVKLNISKEKYITRNDKIIISKDISSYEYFLQTEDVTLTLISDIPNINYYYNEKVFNNIINGKRNSKIEILAKANGYKSKKFKLVLKEDETIKVDLTKKQYGIIKIDKIEIYNNESKEEKIGELTKNQLVEIISVNNSKQICKVKHSNIDGFIEKSSIDAYDDRYENLLFKIETYNDEPIEFGGTTYKITNSKLVIFDLNKNTVIEKYFIDKSDSLSLKFKSDYLFVQGKFNGNGVPSAPLGYEYLYKYKLNNFDIEIPEFHYFVELFNQGEASIRLIESDFSNNKIKLKYSFVEETGFPQLGYGEVIVEYSKLNEIKLESYSFNGKKMNKKYNVTLDQFNSKFKYFIGSNNVLFIPK